MAFVQTGICAVPGKGFPRHFENALAVSQRISSRLSPGGLGRLFPHRRIEGMVC
jgi:hypothetical protein